MSTTSTGRAAEARAAEYLNSKNYTILDRNWRNRWCELDIVATQNGTVHFIEVKFRTQATAGSPSDFITRDKLARLTRASQAWVQAHSYTGPWQIDVISLTGTSIEHTPDITGF